MKRQETAYRNLLWSLSPAIQPTTKWEEIVDRIKDDDAFKVVESEETRREFFENYIKSISEACGHQHSYTSGLQFLAGSGGGSERKRKKKEKKAKKERKRDKKRRRDDDNSPIVDENPHS